MKTRWNLILKPFLFRPFALFLFLIVGAFLTSSDASANLSRNYGEKERALFQAIDALNLVKLKTELLCSDQKPCMTALDPSGRTLIEATLSAVVERVWAFIGGRDPLTGSPLWQRNFLDIVKDEIPQTWDTAYSVLDLLITAGANINQRNQMNREGAGKHIFERMVDWDQQNIPFTIPDKLLCYVLQQGAQPNFPFSSPSKYSSFVDYTICKRRALRYDHLATLIAFGAETVTRWNHIPPEVKPFLDPIHPLSIGFDPLAWEKRDSRVAERGAAEQNSIQLALTSLPGHVYPGVLANLIASYSLNLGQTDQLRLLKKRAEDGEIEAQYEVARLLRLGHHTVKDVALAKEYLWAIVTAQPGQMPARHALIEMGLEQNELPPISFDDPHYGESEMTQKEHEEEQEEEKVEVLSVRQLRRLSLNVDLYPPILSLEDDEDEIKEGETKLPQRLSCNPLDSPSGSSSWLNP